MAARTERAVRVGPGTAADRRASAGEAPRPVDGLPGGRPLREEIGRALGVWMDRRPEDPTVRSGGRLVARASSRSPTYLSPRRGPFSVLYELERYRGSLEILLLLHLEVRATAWRMRQRLRPGPEALLHGLNMLVRIGLVRRSCSGTFPFAKSYELTDLGRELVESPFRAWAGILAP